MENSSNQATSRKAVGVGTAVRKAENISCRDWKGTERLGAAENQVSSADITANNGIGRAPALLWLTDNSG